MEVPALSPGDLIRSGDGNVSKLGQSKDRCSIARVEKLE